MNGPDGFMWSVKVFRSRPVAHEAALFASGQVAFQAVPVGGTSPTCAVISGDRCLVALDAGVAAVTRCAPVAVHFGHSAVPEFSPRGVMVSGLFDLVAGIAGPVIVAPEAPVSPNRVERRFSVRPLPPLAVIQGGRCPGNFLVASGAFRGYANFAVTFQAVFLPGHDAGGGLLVLGHVSVALVARYVAFLVCFVREDPVGGKRFEGRPFFDEFARQFHVLGYFLVACGASVRLGRSGHGSVRGALVAIVAAQPLVFYVLLMAECGQAFQA